MPLINMRFSANSAVVLLLFSGVSLAPAAPAPHQFDQSDALRLPVVGDHQLRLISPDVLELMLITTKPEGTSSLQWNFVNADGSLALPAVSQFSVMANDQSRSVQSVGFKRRVLYAPLKQYDLRVAN